MIKRNKPKAVIIGGLGGSGTRAVASAVEALGYAHGPALNRSEDCLAFTYLFVRTDWMPPPLPGVSERLNSLRSVIEGGEHPLAPDIERLSDAIVRRTPPSGNAPFLVKEPNTHIFADDILEAWSDAVFLFVHRNPVDMAFSRNTNQLKRWGANFGIEVQDFGGAPAAQLALWITAFERHRERQTRFSGRTIGLDYDHFVHAPAATLAASLSAMGLDFDHTVLELACADVRAPESQGRGQTANLSVFTPDQIAYCRRHGWL